MRKHLLVIFCSLLSVLAADAQDAQYSQFYASPLYLNPAFAGANSCSRVASSYRQQWPGIPGKFTSYLVSFDHNFPSKNSSIGVLITRDQAGSGQLASTSGSAMYAYQLNLSRKWTLSTGFQGTYTMRNINFYNLTFTDQLVTGSSSTIEAPAYESVQYFDVSSGMVLFSRRFWAGFAAHHLNTPNQALINDESPLPMKLSFHSGIQLPTGTSDDAKKKINERNITPTINYRHQGRFDQLDLGFYYTYSPVVLGVWYRGIPVMKSFNDNIINDGFIFVAGFTKDRFNFGYSYDVTISRLASSTRGSHEISLSYQFCDPNALKKKRKVQKFIPCAKF